MKIPFIASLRKLFLKEELSNSEKQAVIRLIEKKDKDKRYIQNWRPLSLLNTDVKTISKALAQCLKDTDVKTISKALAQCLKDFSNFC